MKKSFSSWAMVLGSFLLLFTTCKKDSADPSVDILDQPEAPVARAGNDTTIYSPVSTYNLNGSASTDPDSKIVAFGWRLFAGPSAVLIDNYNKAKAFVRGLVNVGNYEFELTVRDADGLSSKDTIKITVVAPNCTSALKEFVFKDLPWDYSWIMEIDIYNFYSYLPPGSMLKNIYIKRDSSTDWEIVVPLNWSSPDYGKVHEWDYGNGVLVIYPGKNHEDDTPDIKIEYCH
jgi:hypothetical protein